MDNNYREIVQKKSEISWTNWIWWKKKCCNKFIQSCFLFYFILLNKKRSFSSEIQFKNWIKNKTIFLKYKIKLNIFALLILSDKLSIWQKKMHWIWINLWSGKNMFAKFLSNFFKYFYFCMRISGGFFWNTVFSECCGIGLIIQGIISIIIKAKIWAVWIFFGSFFSNPLWALNANMNHSNENPHFLLMNFHHSWNNSLKLSFQPSSSHSFLFCSWHKFPLQKNQPPKGLPSHFTHSLKDRPKL